MPLKIVQCIGIDSADLCSLTGRYDNPIPTRFLAPIDCSKCSALQREAPLFVTPLLPLVSTFRIFAIYSIYMYLSCI